MKHQYAEIKLVALQHKNGCLPETMKRKDDIGYTK